jgi:phage terminase Nu1 subunit (DNA packaging protein)
VRAYPVGTIAKLFNLTERRVQQLAKEGIIPKGERGKYDLVECVTAYIKYLQELAFGQSLKPADAHTEKTRLVRAQADHEELKVRERRGELISVGLVESEWTDMVSAMRAKLLSLPVRVAQVAISAQSIREIEENVRTQIYAALEELRATGQSEVADVADTGAAADDNGIGMGAERAELKPGVERGAGEME